MIKVSLFAASAAVVLLGACGPGTPRDACDDAASTYCSKLYKCVDPSTIKSTFGYADQSDCVIKVEATANCANLTCPGSTTFDSSAASQCSTDIDNSACVNNLGIPASCNPTTWCK